MVEPPRKSACHEESFLTPLILPGKKAECYLEVGKVLVPVKFSYVRPAVCRPLQASGVRCLRPRPVCPAGCPHRNRDPHRCPPPIFHVKSTDLIHPVAGFLPPSTIIVISRSHSVSMVRSGRTIVFNQNNSQRGITIGYYTLTRKSTLK